MPEEPMSILIQGLIRLIEWPRRERVEDALTILSTLFQ